MDHCKFNDVSSDDKGAYMSTCKEECDCKGNGVNGYFLILGMVLGGAILYFFVLPFVKYLLV